MHMNWKYLRYVPWLDTRAHFVANVPHGGALLDLGTKVITRVEVEPGNLTLRKWAMALGSNGYRAALAKHPLTPVRISSLRGTVGSQSFTFFSTNSRQSRVARL